MAEHLAATSLTDSERKLAAALMRLAADEFSNHGCNDFDMVKGAGLTLQQCDAVRALYDAYNGDEPMEPVNRAMHADCALMGYLAARFEGRPRG
jgi:hypothetical protein